MGIKRELVIFGVDCDRKKLIVRIVGGGKLAIPSCGQNIFVFTHIEGTELNAGEEVDNVATGTSGMGVDRIADTIIRVNKHAIFNFQEKPHKN